jgi:hypothetical protein
MIDRVCASPLVPVVLVASMMPGCDGNRGSAPAPAAATSTTATTAAAAPGADNALTESERAEGWALLFDGTTPGTHLRGFKREGFPEEWKVEEGCLVLRGPGGDIVTKEQFSDFDFRYDWQVAPGGNSGVMWHVSEEFSYPWETGPEMQVLDDAAHADGKSRLTSAGACYALYPAPEGVVKPAGEWNSAQITVVGPKVTYRLNGTVTAEFDMSSTDWSDRVKGSKFASMPNFGTKSSGHIAIQDHGDVVRFKNLKVRGPGAAPAASTATP